jgi:hypothetical protein
MVEIGTSFSSGRGLVSLPVPEEGARTVADLFGGEVCWKTEGKEKLHLVSFTISPPLDEPVCIKSEEDIGVAVKTEKGKTIIDLAAFKTVTPTQKKRGRMQSMSASPAIIRTKKAKKTAPESDIEVSQGHLLIQEEDPFENIFLSPGQARTGIQGSSAQFSGQDNSFTDPPAHNTRQSQQRKKKGKKQA